MTRPVTRFSLALVVAGALAACQSYPAPLAPAAGPGAAAPAAKAGPQDRRAILKGRVQWSAMRRLMATASDVAANATVTLYDAEGTPVVAGLADANGEFTLYESTTAFTPTTDATFTLEVTRRAATDGSEALLSLRTIVKYTGSTYTSITGETIVVSARTTAMAQLEAEDDAASPADAIGKVDGDVVQTVDDTDIVFGDTTTGDIEEREADVVADLEEDLDPNQIYPMEYDGDVTISSAADLADFKRLGTVTGNLTISYDGAADFELPFLREVYGTLNIIGIEENGVPATDLGGLDKLESAGAVYISVASLTSLDGLGNLVEVDGNLELENMGAGFTSLNALAALESIGGTLDVNDAPGLADVDLPALADLGGLELVDLPALTTLAGLNDATFPEADVDVETTINIVNAPLITSLAGLGGSGKLHRLDLGGCDALTSLAGLGDTTEITEFYVDRVALTSLDSLPPSLASISEFTFANSADDPAGGKLTSLAGLDGVYIGDLFHLDGQPDVTSLAGPGFETQLTDFHVENCDGLTTLGFPNTEVIIELTHALHVIDNDGLTSIGLTGLDQAADGVDTIGTGGGATFVFKRNTAFTAICEPFLLGAERLVGGVPDTDIAGDVSMCNVD